MTYFDFNLGEWIGPAAITWMMHELIENDAEHSDLTENLDWFFLPVVNPDGYAYTQSNDRMWRKTRYIHLSKNMENCF